MILYIFALLFLKDFYDETFNDLWKLYDGTVKWFRSVELHNHIFRINKIEICIYYVWNGAVLSRLLQSFLTLLTEKWSLPLLLQLNTLKDKNQKTKELNKCPTKRWAR